MTNLPQFYYYTPITEKIEDIIQYLSQNLGIKHETGEENCTEERKMHLQIN